MLLQHEGRTLSSYFREFVGNTDFAMFFSTRGLKCIVNPCASLLLLPAPKANQPNIGICSDLTRQNATKILCLKQCVRVGRLSGPRHGWYTADANMKSALFDVNSKWNHGNSGSLFSHVAGTKSSEVKGFQSKTRRLHQLENEWPWDLQPKQTQEGRRFALHVFLWGWRCKPRHGITLHIRHILHGSWRVVPTLGRHLLTLPWPKGKGEMKAEWMKSWKIECWVCLPYRPDCEESYTELHQSTKAREPHSPHSYVQSVYGSASVSGKT